MLGSLAYIAPMFGPDTLPMIEDQLISTAERFFSPNVVNEIIEPTVRDIVRGARGEVVSVGFVISLWAGSSAISAFVDSITEAHDQTPLRHPVRQRFFALGLYVVMLIVAIVTAPFIALGPRKIAEFIPDSWDNVLRYGYYPALFLGLDTHQHDRSDGALATPIAVLLFAFFHGFAIMLGAELNAAVEEEWPAPVTHAKRFRKWLEEKAAESRESLNGGSAGAESPATATTKGDAPTS